MALELAKDRLDEVVGACDEQTTVGIIKVKKEAGREQAREAIDVVVGSGDLADLAADRLDLALSLSSIRICDFEPQFGRRRLDLNLKLFVSDCWV